MQERPDAAMLMTEIPEGLRKAFRWNSAFSFDLFAFRPKYLVVPGHTNPFGTFRRTDVHDYICQPLKKVKVCPPEMFPGCSLSTQGCPTMGVALAAAPSNQSLYWASETLGFAVCTSRCAHRRCSCGSSPT
jgi:hypothetical protein